MDSFRPIFIVVYQLACDCITLCLTAACALPVTICAVNIQDDKSHSGSPPYQPKSKWTASKRQGDEYSRSRFEDYQSRLT
ncbi:hypothetical protein AAC387_Pa05g3792 [Persea americana]